MLFLSEYLDDSTSSIPLKSSPDLFYAISTYFSYDLIGILVALFDLSSKLSISLSNLFSLLVGASVLSNGLE